MDKRGLLPWLKSIMDAKNGVSFRYSLCIKCVIYKINTITLAIPTLKSLEIGLFKQRLNKISIEKICDETHERAVLIVQANSSSTALL